MHQAVVLDEGLQVQKVDHFQLEEQSYAEMVREVIVSGDVETLRGLLSERMVNAEFVKTATGSLRTMGALDPWLFYPKRTEGVRGSCA